MAPDSFLEQFDPDSQPAGANLARQLQAALPGAQAGLLRLVAAQAEGLQMPIYVVGGVVRDLLLERPITDADLVVEGDAIRLGRALVKAHGGRLVAHQRFGTAVWELGEIASHLGEELGQPAADLPDSLDLISARKEHYEYPGALPTVEKSSIEEDLRRRDFGINTLALRLDGEHYGELIDPWGGLADLRAGRLRVLHGASFGDDPTRILRILRFAGRLDFEIEAQTLDWLHQGLPGLGSISPDRIRHELDAILLEDQRAAILKLAQEEGVLPAIHPALVFKEGAEQSLAPAPEDPPGGPWDFEAPLWPDLGYLLWLQHLDDEQALEAAAMLNFPGDLLRALAALQRLDRQRLRLGKLAPSQVVAALEGMPLLALYAASVDAGEDDLRDVLESYVGEWRQLQPTVDGHELRRRGLPPGPAYSRILDALRAAWLDGLVSNPDEEKELLEQLIADYDG